MRIAIVTASLLLTACAAPPQQASAALDTSLAAMIGQPVGAAFARLGQPMASARMGEETVYGWGQAVTGTELMTPRPGFIDAAEAQGGVFPPPRRTLSNHCIIRIIAGADGLIRDWDYQGDGRGCRLYADRLAEAGLAAAG